MYEDAKHGPSIELTWSRPSKDTKHYHVNHFSISFLDKHRIQNISLTFKLTIMISTYDII